MGLGGAVYILKWTNTELFCYYLSPGNHAEESNGAAAVPMDLRKHKVAHVLSGHEVFAVMMRVRLLYA